MHATLRHAAVRLGDCLRSFGGPAHVVAHSLGAIVALEAYVLDPGLPPGRIVLLGGPVQGSRAARSIVRWVIGPQILGQLGAAELCRPYARRAPAGREVGVIAGSLSAGLGRLFAELPQPNDGTVAVEETRLPGAAAEIILDVSHTGMLLSAAVANATAAFLSTGRFPAAAH
jgi:hypothetical protein